MSMVTEAAPVLYTRSPLVSLRSARASMKTPMTSACFVHRPMRKQATAAAFVELQAYGRATAERARDRAAQRRVWDSVLLRDRMPDAHLASERTGHRVRRVRRHEMDLLMAECECGMTLMSVCKILR